MRGDAALWRRAAAGEIDDLIAEAGDASGVASVARLRKRADAETVAVALEIVDARRRLATKVSDVSRWIADSAGAQMATDSLVATHKAQRFVSKSSGATDLCCGIGADAAAFREAGLEVQASDLDERRCVMAAHNARVTTRVDDAASADVAGRVVHLDPARRDHAGRLVRLADLVPGPDVISRVVCESAGAGVKLMPGVDADELGALVPSHVVGEVEYISLRGRLNQAVWWTGALAQQTRSATMIADGVMETVAGEPVSLGWCEAELGAWLYQPDPAPERAGLLGVLAEQLGLDVLHPALGVLTGDELVRSPWLTPFRVHERLPWRLPRVREMVHSLGGGIVEVKTRGGACDPDAVQKQLRGKGERALTVFILRFGDQIEAIVAERIKSG